MNERLKNLVRRNWLVRLPVLMLLRPQRFMSEFVYALADYRKFRASVAPFRAIVDGAARPKDNGPALLIAAGPSTNTQWCQLWSVLAAAYRTRGYRLFVLTSRNEPVRNLYFTLMRIEHVFMEDLGIRDVAVPAELTARLATLTSFADFKEFEIDGVPFGQIAMSTYGRLRVSGVVDVEAPGAREELRRWIAITHQTMVAAGHLYERLGVEMLFFTEVFMEEYGGLYYEALNRHLNIVRFAGTVRDDAVVVQHMTRESDRTHHASLSAGAWARIAAYPDSPTVQQELEQNFLDRYGQRWALSSRNQPNTRLMTVEEARATLGVPPDRKIAVIFSHILYDTLFFFGVDLFPIYADWFIASVKAACANPKLQWFVKVHPSNLWRGELEQYFGGEYEEVRLIKRYVGELPPHVQLVYPDTPISPYTWFQLCDFGVTVRGTSGIELGALGKTVITAGSGRYEAAGFSVNSNSADEYLQRLAALPDLPPPTPAQRKAGERFAYATFCMKPFTLDFLTPVPRTGKSRIFGSEDLVYLGKFPEGETALPPSILRFMQWSVDRNAIDFLADWPGARGAASAPVEPIRDAVPASRF